MAEEANTNVELNRKRKLDDDDEEEVHQPFTKKRKITFDLETNFVLPHEIMIDIMESLDPDDLKTCSEVCKYWLTCSQEIVGWTYVSTIVSYPNTNIQNSYEDKIDKLFPGAKPETKEQDSIPLHVKWHKNTNNWRYEVVSYNNAVVSDSSGQYVFSISSSGVRPKKGAYNDNPKGHLLFDVFDFFANHNEPLTSWRIDAFVTRLYRTSLNGPYYGYQGAFKIYVDAKQLQRALYSGEEFPGVNLIFKYGVKSEVNRMLDKEYRVIAELSKAMFPYLPPKMEPPKGLKEGFKFHRYQVDAISWMKSIENNVDKEFKYCDLVPWRASRTSLLFDLHNEKIVLPDKVDEYIGSFKSKGGVLADQVGLGKTVELIGLTLTSQDEKLSEFDENGLFNTKASLVICPNHLAMQWSQEVSKYTNLKVSMVTTTEDFRSTTYGDIVNSGFVIMTSQVFKNKNYFTLGCGKKKMSVSIPGMAKRNALVADYLDQIKGSTKLSTVGPIMDHFHFKRIIIDEAHEVFQDAFATLCILPLKKEFGWYVSATPFPSDLLFGPAKKFLEIWKPDYESEETLADEYEEYVENDIIVSNLLWRNTKESIHEEYTVPEYEEELILAEFHPIEAVMHKYGERYENLQLCCGMMYTLTTSDGYNINRKAPASMTFDDLKDWWIADLERAISRMKEKRKHGETSSWYSKEAQAKLEAQKKEVESVPYIVKDKKLKPDEAVYMGRVNQYGTKFAKLIQWISDTIAEDATNRFILFSKREYYVHQVSKRLRSAGIDNVLISGTVVSKSKALKQFREEDVKVMVLSLDRSASGMNLIEANYVVLLDPMDGTVEEARANEIQALGRAHRQGQEQKVTLVRFVIQDSVEEELYLRNKSSGRETLQRTASTKQLLAKSNSAASLRNILLKSK